jgi:phosphoglycerol transferase MdoB-like AlkP superfamily enzyme
LLVVGVRGLDHRPLNPSSAAFSGDHLLNQLALNSLYSAGYAAYATRKERSPADLYGRMDEEEILARVGAYTDFVEDTLPGPIPFLHVQRARSPLARPRNLVVILEESLGAAYVGCLGGLPLTPNLDALAEEGLLLTNLYSTGTRTVRGIEATVAGFLPTPADAVVKLPRAQRDFFTVAELLRRHGYATDFVYGGESHFDGMAAFLLANGFERAHDESDYENPVFRGTWGVSDEDLMREAHSIFLSHGDRPFFALVLTTSNHSPFEYPPGRIEPHDPEPATRENAMKYADHALGELFRMAEGAEYHEDTVWVVVADHDTRVYGDDLIPVSKFRIPGLILGPGVEPGRFEPVASQIDLAPTALGLLGLETTHPMIGRDLLRAREGDPGRAVLQYYEHHGLLVGDRFVLHVGGAPARCFRYLDGRLAPDDLDPELVRDALAHALLPGLLYSRGSYRLPAGTGQRRDGAWPRR